MICQISNQDKRRRREKKKKEEEEEKRNEGYTTTRLGSIQIYGPDSRLLRTLEGQRKNNKKTRKREKQKGKKK